MLEKIKTIVPLILIAILILAIISLPQLMETISMDKFAKPLHMHEVPENAVILHKGVQYQADDSGMIAVMLLQTDMTLEETEAFYSDILSMEEAQNEDLILAVEKMDESHLDAVKESGYYTETRQHYFVYIYNDSLAKPLFDHVLPKDSQMFFPNVYYNEEQRTKTAEVTLGTMLTPEETEAFYADLLSGEGAEGQLLTLEVTELSEEDMDRITQRDDYNESLRYYRVCLHAH